MLEKAKNIIEGRWCQHIIIGLIIINAIILGLETSNSIMQQYGYWLKTIDIIILGIFVIEILAKMVVYRWQFFNNAWRLFDLAIIAIALMPSAEIFSALRALRILRLIAIIPTMRRVIEGLLSAIPGIMAVASIMVLLFYIFALIGTHLYGATFPAWFGTLGATMYSLFQIMTLESWSMGIVRPVMEQHPYAWIFFIIYILVTTFTMLNLFIAIIVNAMHQDEDEAAQQQMNEMQQNMKDMEKRLLHAINNKK